MAKSIDFDQALNELDVLLQSDLSTAQKKLAEYETAFSSLTPTQKGRLRIDRAISYIFVLAIDKLTSSSDEEVVNIITGICLVFSLFLIIFNTS